jgi:hypothetical protein
MLACGFGEGLSSGAVDFVLESEAVVPIIYSNDFFTEGSVNYSG